MTARITAARVADFLERGLLDVLIDLFTADPVHYALLGDLLADRRIAVRLGACALVEELSIADPERCPLAAAALAPLLAAADPVHRGDAAYLLGFAGGVDDLAALDATAAADPNADVREAAAEAVAKIGVRLTGMPLDRKAV